jgi:hypothetical protein
MKKATSKKSTPAKRVFIPLFSDTKAAKSPKIANRNLQVLSDLIKVEYKKTPKAILPYLTLSAARAKVPNKGWINAIGCNSVFPDDPNMGFNPTTTFGGKIELWLTDIKQGEGLAIQFKVCCGSSGTWKVSSSEITYSLIPIQPVMQSIDFFIPPITTDESLVLVVLEPTFNGLGSWVFYNVVVNKVEF